MGNGIKEFKQFIKMCSLESKCVINERKWLDIAEDYLLVPDKYVHTFATRVNNKRRNIVTYNNDEYGLSLQKLHILFADLVWKHYKSSEWSFAYKKHQNILSCIEKHKQSDCFLKTDIHSYFDTVDYEILKRRMKAVPFFKIREDELSILLSACFYNGHLPIGFCSSPVLSDIYLTRFDKCMAQRGLEKGYCYTRYADDFIISSKGENAGVLLAEELVEIEAMLETLKLSLNEKKTYIRKLKQEGDSIHLLGLNLVKTDSEENRITVSHRYICEVCKEICALEKGVAYGNAEDIPTKPSEVFGKVSWIKMASTDSYEKLKKMIAIKSGHSIDLENFEKTLREM